MATLDPSKILNLTQLGQQAAARHGLDPRLVDAVSQQESGYNPSARSSAGATGLMQLMPDTAKQLGVDPTDPAQNIEGGTRYLKQLHDQFGGDTDLALAAYNAGPGNVQKAGNKIPNIPETQNYVQSIKAKMGGGADNAPSGGSVVLDPSKVTLAPSEDGGEDLGRVRSEEHTSELQSPYVIS